MGLVAVTEGAGWLSYATLLSGESHREIKRWDQPDSGVAYANLTAVDAIADLSVLQVIAQQVVPSEHGSCHTLARCIARMKDRKIKDHDG